MSRHIVEALLLTAGLSVMSHAQQTTQSPPRSGAKVVVTGCVERADQVPRGAVQASDPDSLSFVLIETPASASANASPAAAAEARAQARVYRLDSTVATMNPHVGHRVELRGTIVEQPPAAAATGGPAPGPRLHVDDIRSVSETCAR